MALTIGSFCTGIGGLDLATAAHFNAEVAWHCEFDAAPSKVLEHHFPGVPNHGDIKNTDWSQVAPVDIITAGYPCQPFSTAGKRKGSDDERHLWPTIRDAIGVLRPRFVVLENVRGHLSLGFADVLADLACLGFNAEWGCFRSSDVGAPHRRERLYVVATDADTDGIAAWRDCGAASGTETKDGPGQPYGDRSQNGGTTAADAYGIRSNRAGGSRDRRPELADSSQSVTDADGAARCNEQDGRTKTREQTSLWYDVSGRCLGDEGVGRLDCGISWGDYWPAVERWERLTGTVVPAPLDEKGRLAPALAEWMMGYPAGWVTDPAIGLTRAQQLKACGNAVQPQTAALALAELTVR